VESEGELREEDGRGLLFVVEECVSTRRKNELEWVIFLDDSRLWGRQKSKGTNLASALSDILRFFSCRLPNYPMRRTANQSIMISQAQRVNIEVN
jgi:hypothetical protein